MKQEIVALPGDGIGPEVVSAALSVLEACCQKWNLDVDVETHLVGGAALERHGDPLPDYVLKACLKSGVVLLGAVGDPKFDREPPNRRPEKALLRLRSELGLYANLRPVRMHGSLLASSPLKPEVVSGVDLLFVRELTGGIYFGQPRGIELREGRRVGFNTEVYSEDEIERIARVAFEAARQRRLEVASVDKSNVLESSQLWRTVVEEVASDYPGVRLRHVLVDNCAMQLMSNPKQFDVVLTNNMFGDILSDEASMLAGSIGMLPSASLGVVQSPVRRGMYEPVHGSAPDIAGRGIANPLATIGSLAMLLRHSLNHDHIAVAVEEAVDAVVAAGVRPADLAGGGPSAGTQEVAAGVIAELRA